MKANNSYYFATKPLQYYNCVNLTSEDKNDKYLFIIFNFNKADDFVNNIKKYDSRWKKIILIDSKLDNKLSEYKVTGKDQVYVHSDMHWELKFNGCFINANVNVYEEGLGSYATEITSITKSWWKNLVVKLMTRLKLINSVTGGHKLTKAVYVYDKLLYQKVNNKNAIKSKLFKYSFYQNYLNNKHSFDSIFNLNDISYPQDSRIALFLTSNDPGVDYLSKLNEIDRNRYDELIFKPHPNIAANYAEINNVYTDIMAELLIVKLLDCGNSVDVYHFGTAVELYIKSDSVNFIKL